jgi:hypothetical protein
MIRPPDSHIVLPRWPRASHAGLFDGQAHLLRSEALDAFFFTGQAAGVHHHERTCAGAAHAVMAVSRDARHVCHQGVAAARQCVEEGRFNDIGTTDHGNDGQNEESLFNIF